MSPLSSANFVGTDNRLGACGACGIALSADTNPQLLPCLHSVCGNCIGLPTRNHEVAVCPLCGTLYSSNNVTPNPLFCDVSSKTSSQKCGGCEGAAAEGWCVECGEALCVECVSAHRRVRMTRDHTIQTQISSSGFSRKTYCTIHRDEPYQLYCLTCRQLTCRDCQLTLHRNHSFKFVGEVVSECRQQLETLALRVKEQRAYTQRSLQDVEGRLLDLEDVQEGFKDGMKKALQELRDILVQTAMKMMSDTKILCASEINRLKVQQMELQKLQERQEYLLAFTQKTLESMNQSVLLSCANQVQMQLQAVLTQNPPPFTKMLHISLYLNKQDIQESLRHFGKVSWKLIPFACSKKNRAPKKVRETQLAPVPAPAPAVSLGTPDTAVPPMSTRGSSVSSPMKAMAESTTSSPDCSEGKPGPDSAMSTECEPSSTVPDSVGRPSCGPGSPPQADPSSVTTTGNVTKISWDDPEEISEISAAAPSASYPTQLASASGSVGNTDRESVSTGTSVLLTQAWSVGGNAKGLAEDTAVGIAAGETDSFAKAESEGGETGHVQRVETRIPKMDVLRLRPHHIQRDTEHVQGAESEFPKIANVLGAESKCRDTEDMRWLESGHQKTEHVQGAESKCRDTEDMRWLESGHQKTEHVQGAESEFPKIVNVQGAESECRDTEDMWWLESGHQKTEHAQEVEPGHRDSQLVQEPEFECRRTEHVQEVMSNGVMTEHVQEPESDSIVTEHVQEAESDCAIMEHVRAAPPDVALCPDVSQSSTAPSGSLPLPPSPQEGPTLQCFLEALNLVAVRTPQLASSSASSDPRGTGAAGQDTYISSYCCPLEGDDFDDDEEDYVDVEMQDEEIYQLLPKKHWLPQVSVYHMSLPTASVGQPPPQFRLLQGESSMEFMIQEITEDDESTERKAPVRVAAPDPVQHSRCVACRVEGLLYHCTACNRGYHRGCHIPPLINKLGQDWVCGLCIDVSKVRQDVFERGSCMSAQDQQKCEHLLLSLWCCKYRSALFMQNQQAAGHPASSAIMNITIIRGRLLQKLPPPYRTPTEFVSDIWLLLDTLLKKSKWKAEREKQLRSLQMIFSRRLHRVFGPTLHPSVQRNPFRQGPGRQKRTLDRRQERTAERGGQKTGQRRNPRRKRAGRNKGEQTQSQSGGSDSGRTTESSSGVTQSQSGGSDSGRTTESSSGVTQSQSGGSDSGRTTESSSGVLQVLLLGKFSSLDSQKTTEVMRLT